MCLVNFCVLWACFMPSWRDVLLLNIPQSRSIQRGVMGSAVHSRGPVRPPTLLCTRYITLQRAKKKLKAFLSFQLLQKRGAERPDPQRRASMRRSIIARPAPGTHGKNAIESERKVCSTIFIANCVSDHLTKKERRHVLSNLKPSVQTGFRQRELGDGNRAEGFCHQEKKNK